MIDHEYEHTVRSSACAFLSLSLQGLFFSIGNTIGNISGVIAPIVAGQILQAGKSSGGGGCGGSSNHSREAWQEIFYIAAALYGASAIIFFLFMPGKPVQKLN